MGGLLVRRVLGWSLALGCALALALAAGRAQLARLFTPDPAVAAALAGVMPIVVSGDWVGGS